MYYFIVNPSSRSGRGKLVWRSVEQILEKEEVEYRVFFTAYRYHATQLAREITSRNTRVILVAVGGDGTVDEIIGGIQDFSKVTFAYIPTGSSNDFARSLDLPISPEAAIHNILHPSYYRTIDLGLASYRGRRHYFAVSCGCGFDAAVCHEAIASPLKNLLNRLKLGKLTYVGIALKQILMFRKFPMTLLLDENRKLHFKHTYFISAMNCSYEGGGLKMCPDAQTDDGLLDLCVVEGLSKLTIALMFPTAFWGKHLIFRGIHIYRVKSAEIYFTGGIPFHADGEPFTIHNTFQVSCIPKVLTVIAGK
jgi:YegS/Rv2252/BmrU family lipid kinase